MTIYTNRLLEALSSLFLKERPFKRCKYNIESTCMFILPSWNPSGQGGVRVMAVKSPQWQLSQGSISLAHCWRPNIQSDQIRTHVVLIALVVPSFVMWIQHDRGLGLQGSNIDRCMTIGWQVTEMECHTSWPRKIYNFAFTNHRGCQHIQFRGEVPRYTWSPIYGSECL